VIVVVAGDGFGTIQPERSCGVRVGVEQSRRQVIYGRRVGSGSKSRLPGRIGRVRIGGEVVIEGDVLIENNYQVLDGSCGGHRRR
jgi:hypothetical protein